MGHRANRAGRAPVRSATPGRYSRAQVCAWVGAAPSTLRGWVNTRWVTAAVGSDAKALVFDRQSLDEARVVASTRPFREMGAEAVRRATYAIRDRQLPEGWNGWVLVWPSGLIELRETPEELVELMRDDPRGAAILFPFRTLGAGEDIEPLSPSAERLARVGRVA